jgi:hypothetical protein
MGLVLGATTAATLALWAAYRDDEDFQKRPEYDRDNNWWFKVGGVAFRVPKPFEVGAIATMAERVAEWITTTEPEAGKRFAQRIASIFGEQLSMNPTPQAIKPMVEQWANKSFFTGNDIETEAQKKLDPSERVGKNTTLPRRCSRRPIRPDYRVARAGRRARARLLRLGRATALHAATYRDWVGAVRIAWAIAAARIIP